MGKPLSQITMPKKSAPLVAPKTSKKMAGDLVTNDTAAYVVGIITHGDVHGSQHG